MAPQVSDREVSASAFEKCSNYDTLSPEKCSQNKVQLHFYRLRKDENPRNGFIVRASHGNGENHK